MSKIILNRNEIIAGPSPACLRAIKTFDVQHASCYLEGYYTSCLIPELAKEFQLPEGQIMAGYGSEHLLSIIFAFAAGSSVLTHEHHYGFYDKYLESQDIPVHLFRTIEKNKEFVFDIDNCIAQYKKFRPKVLLITSPNNPTGNTISLHDIKKILAAVSDDCLVVLDEAYWGLDPAYKEQAILSLLRKKHNLVLIRTFSKLYALAGLRIGFALCGPEVLSKLHYQRPYLGFSRILEEVAVAALKSEKYYQTLSKKIITDRDTFIREVNKLKQFNAYLSKATFVLVKVSEEALPILETHIDQADFSISKTAFGNFIRVSLEPKKYTKKFIKLLQNVDGVAELEIKKNGKKQ